MVAAGLRAGHTPRNWLAPARPVGAMDAKAELWACSPRSACRWTPWPPTPDAPGFYHPGRSGTVRQGPKTVLGTFGELHPRVLAALDLPGPAAAFELFLDARRPSRSGAGRPRPDLPAVPAGAARLRLPGGYGRAGRGRAAGGAGAPNGR